MPNRYLIANWKMNVPEEGVPAFIRALAAAEASGVRLVVAPPFPKLQQVRILAGERMEVAAQNCADHSKGAFTGEVAPSMILDAGARFVILGHSERRRLYGEDDALVARKLSLAITEGLIPILCIGEDLRLRESEQTGPFLAGQIRACAVAELEEAREVIVAYEPVWAIGTGRNASGPMVAEAFEMIRESIHRFWPGNLARNLPLVYGGSVNPDNVSELVKEGRVDGFLVGGASLASASFLSILKSLADGGGA